MMGCAKHCRTKLYPTLLSCGLSFRPRCNGATVRTFSLLAPRINKRQVGQFFKYPKWRLTTVQSRALVNWTRNSTKAQGTGSGGGNFAKTMLKDLWARMPAHVQRSIKLGSVVVVTLMLISKVINVLVPIQFKKLVDYLNVEIGLNTDSQKTSIATGAIAIVIAYFLARVGANFTQELRNLIFASADQSFIRYLKRWFFQHLHNLDSNFHSQRRLGALYAARDRGTRGLSNIVGALVKNIIPTVFEFFLVGGVLYMQCGWQYTAVVAACIGTYSLFTVKVTTMRNVIRRAENKAETAASNQVSDSLINYDTIKLFNNEAYESEEYDKCLRALEKATLKTQYTLAGLNFGQHCIISSGLLAIMYLACGDIASGVLTVGDLVMVNQLLFQLSVPLNFLGTFWREISTAVIDLQDLYNLLQRQPAIQSVLGAPNLYIPSNTAPSIIFDDVKFHYVEDKPILRGVSFEVPSGKKMAIVGGSGSGKSTIVRLLYRQYDPTDGRVLINNQDIKEVELNSVRQTIGIVPQDTVLFHNDVFYNIHYGNKNATEEQVYEKAKMAEMHDTIMKFPHQYKIKVGERGMQLSGGEKQRIAIARVFLKDSPIFVYDEATSSLDSITEDKIMTALKRVSEHRTTIVIAHRLSTVVEADEICVLSDGQIAERGNHYQLLANSNSLYSYLWNKQHEAFLK